MRKLLIVLCLVLTVSNTANLLAQENSFIEEYLERLENSRKYLKLVAESMPEDSYNYQVTPESLSFAQNLMHIGFAMDWHAQSLLGDREARDWQTDTVFKVGNKSKDEMIQLIDQTFAEAIELIKKFDPDHLEDQLDYFGLDRTKRQILLLLADHITHHRGQMLVALRLNGVTPPRYVLFQ